MFFVEGIAGFIAQSSGLLADALDMLSDASTYAVSLLAIGRAHELQRYREDEVHRLLGLHTRRRNSESRLIVAGLLVIATMSRWPDLLIGTGIGVYVLCAVPSTERSLHAPVGHDLPRR